MAKKSFLAREESAPAPVVAATTPGAVTMVDAASVMKRRNECCVVEDDTKKVKETIWQVGQGHYFIAPGTEKATRRSEYLGLLSHKDGVLTFNVSMSNPVTPGEHYRVVRSRNYMDVLGLAYACKRVLKINGQPVLGEVK